MFFSSIARMVAGATAVAGAKPTLAGNHHVAAVRARETLRHLAAAGISDADEQHALLVRRSHSFSRNRLCTRASLVSSG